jgi:hypothetical protein
VVSYDNEEDAADTILCIWEEMQRSSVWGLLIYMCSRGACHSLTPSFLSELHPFVCWVQKQAGDCKPVFSWGWVLWHSLETYQDTTLVDCRSRQRDCFHFIHIMIDYVNIKQGVSWDCTALKCDRLIPWQVLL